MMQSSMYWKRLLDEAAANVHGTQECSLQAAGYRHCSGHADNRTNHASEVLIVKLACEATITTSDFKFQAQT